MTSRGPLIKPGNIGKKLRAKAKITSVIAVNQVYTVFSKTSRIYLKT